MSYSTESVDPFDTKNALTYELDLQGLNHLLRQEARTIWKRYIRLEDPSLLLRMDMQSDLFLIPPIFTSSLPHGFLYARGRLGVHSTTPFSQIKAIYHRLAETIPSQPDALENDEVDEELLYDFLDCHERYEHLKMHHITLTEVADVEMCLSPVASMSPSESLFPKLTDKARSASLSTTASEPSSNPTLDFNPTPMPEANETNRMPVCPPAPLSITKCHPSSSRSTSIDVGSCRTCANSAASLGPETLHSLRLCEGQLHSLHSLAVNTLPRHTTAEYDLLYNTVTRLRASIDAALNRVQIRYPPVSSKVCCTKHWCRLGVPLAQIAVTVNLIGDLEERETKGTRKRAVMALLRWETLLMGAE